MPFVSRRPGRRSNRIAGYLFFLAVGGFVLLVLAFYFRGDVHRLIHHFRSAGTVQSPVVPAGVQLKEAVQLLAQNKTDEALAMVNRVIKSDPQNAEAYQLRGGICAGKELWDQAGQDYQAALQLDSDNVQTKFGVAELQFMQRKYNVARPGFFALEQDPEVGDLAAYKVFLCDLFDGHDDVAAKELAAFNRVDTDASYYFANAAWALHQHKMDEAQGWLKSAANIYAPNKFRRYAASLNNAGYLSFAPPAQH